MGNKVLELNYYAVSALSNALTTFAIAIMFVFQSKTYRKFVAFNIFVAGWSVCYFFWQLSTTYESAEFWLKLLMLFVVFIPQSFSCFIFEFVGKKGSCVLGLRAFSMLIILFSIPIILNTDLYIRAIEPAMHFEFWPKAGKLFWIFLGYFGVNVFVGLFNLYERYQETKSKTVYYIGAFTAVAFSGGSSNFLMWYDIPFPPVLNISTSIYAFLIGIFFIHSESRDLKITVGRIAAPFLLLLVVVISYVVLASLIFPFDKSDWVYFGLQTACWLLVGPKIFNALHKPMMQEVHQHKKDQKRLDGLNRLEEDLKKAHDIQQKMLPSRVPTFSGFKIEAEFKASQYVSGDYYNIHKISDHEVVIMISDMVGKGIVASMYMLFLHRLIQVQFMDCRSPKDFMNQLNRDICDDFLLDRYVPLTFLYINTKTRKVKYSNAGHEPFLYAGNNTIKSVDSTNIPLGLDPEEEYIEKELDLKSGERLVLFSDGLTDITDQEGQRLGIDGATMMLASKFKGDIFGGLIDGWNRYKGNNDEQDDDFTLLVLSFDDE